METNKMPSQISQQIQETMNHIEYWFLAYVIIYIFIDR